DLDSGVDDLEDQLVKLFGTGFEPGLFGRVAVRADYGMHLLVVLLEVLKLRVERMDSLEPALQVGQTAPGLLQSKVLLEMHYGFEFLKGSTYSCPRQEPAVGVERRSTWRS